MIETAPEFDISYVVGFAFDSNYKHVWLVKKNRPNWMVGLLNGIGGKIELQDEDSAAAMEREFFEETGLRVPSYNWTHYIRINGMPNSRDLSTFLIDIFHVKLDDISASQISTVTDEEIVKVPVNDLPDTVIPNLRWMIPLALDGYILGPTIMLSGDELPVITRPAARNVSAISKSTSFWDRVVSCLRLP